MKHHRAVLRCRRGFTLVELLVTVSLIAVLMSLLLPAVQSAREASRRTQCLNNVRNLGLAMLNSADAGRRFSASGYIATKNGGPVPSHSWVVDLLGYLDRPDIYQQWDFGQTLADPPNAQLANTHLQVLVCPTDITITNRGDLSYVVNGGFGVTHVVDGVTDCPCDVSLKPFDLNGNGIFCPVNVSADGQPGDKEIFFETGMFFVENFPISATGTVRHHTLDDIVDGSSNTIMIAENVRTGVDPFRNATNWAAADGRLNSFFLPAAICSQLSCKAGNVDYGRANSGQFAINYGLKMPEGDAPWPNSYHPGGVSVGFVDGRAKLLSDQIAGAVYASLVSPQGVRLRGPLAQRVFSDADY